MTYRGLHSENTIETSQAKHFQRLSSAQFAKKLLKIAKFVKEFFDSVIWTRDATIFCFQKSAGRFFGCRYKGKIGRLIGMLPIFFLYDRYVCLCIGNYCPWEEYRGFRAKYGICQWSSLG
jgi:hypothetical protein